MRASSSSSLVILALLDYKIFFTEGLPHLLTCSFLKSELINN